MKPADVVLDAIESRRLIGLLSDSDPSLDEDGAYAIAGGSGIEAVDTSKRRTDAGS